MSLKFVKFSVPLNGYGVALPAGTASNAAVACNLNHNHVFSMTMLYYFHDPMCSWCWGYRSTLQQLIASLPQGVMRTNILGGLAPDNEEPMPQEQREAIASNWRRIEDMLGTRFNHDFWTQCEPRRSTYPACRAVIAAARQGREEEMIEAIQNAYYLQAQNPSDLQTLQWLSGQLGLDAEAFRKDYESNETEAELQRQIRFARESGIAGFPSLALETDGQLVPIKVDYSDYQCSLNEINRILDRHSSR